MLFIVNFVYGLVLLPRLSCIGLCLIAHLFCLYIKSIVLSIYSMYLFPCGLITVTSLLFTIIAFQVSDVVGDHHQKYVVEYMKPILRSGISEKWFWPNLESSSAPEQETVMSDDILQVLQEPMISGSSRRIT